MSEVDSQPRHIPEDHLTPEELKDCVEKLMPILRNYGTSGLEQATEAAQRQWDHEIAWDVEETEDVGSIFRD